MWYLNLLSHSLSFRQSSVMPTATGFISSGLSRHIYCLSLTLHLIKKANGTFYNSSFIAWVKGITVLYFRAMGAHFCVCVRVCAKDLVCVLVHIPIFTNQLILVSTVHNFHSFTLRSNCLPLVLNASSTFTCYTASSRLHTY
jgi:ABC-type glycerol-3-phosphate transport system permease component